MRSKIVRVGIVVVLYGLMSPVAQAVRGAKGPKPAKTQTAQQPQQQQQAPPQPVDHSGTTTARQDITTATADLNKLTVALNVVTARLRREKLEPTAPWKEAQAVLTKAQTEYETAKRAAVATLKDDPKYQAIMADRFKAQSDHDALSPDSSFDDRTRIAKAMMDGADAAGKMETAAIAADGNTAKAKAALDAANAKMTEITTTFDTTLGDVPEYASAAKAVDDAKQKLDTAKKALADAQTREAQAEAARQKTAQR